jgi:hypothetical protein
MGASTLVPLSYVKIVVCCKDVVSKIIPCPCYIYIECVLTVSVSLKTTWNLWVLNFEIIEAIFLFETSTHIITIFKVCYS